MNEHVFTTTASASSTRSAMAKPSRARVPSITSVSMRFLGQPSEWK
jgi:hypothetical protein